jgi:histidyl-tRNA synthetase
MQETPQLLKGFRDFLPAEKRKRDYVMSKIKEVFERFGFEPLETPTLEYASLLLGKYGDEADKLVYTFEDRGERQVGLRYDQTVPTARVLAQYQNELPRYFRRYQMQNVFRADKPQKGRFREFTQCDIDIFGSTSPLADAEILACTYEVYKNIGFKTVQLNINDRQVLMATLSPFATEQVTVFSLIQTIDKLDKVSVGEAVEELINKGLAKTSAQAAIEAISTAQPSENLQAILKATRELGVPDEALVFNPRIARGLDYYTGMIFEVTITEYPVGSVGGGGRYDNLIRDLGGPEVPAVGIAYGFDRTVEAADQLGLIPTANSSTQVLVTVFDEKTQGASLVAAQQLRAASLRTELYPAVDKIGKQFKLADQKQIPWVIIIGEAEVAQNQVTLKNMASGEQTTLTLSEAINLIK